MPKLKTHKGLSSRVRVTRTGKVVRHRAGKSHLLSAKSAKRRRYLRRTTLMAPAFARTAIQKLGGS